MARSDEETEEELDHVRSLIREGTRRLRFLEQRAAQQGRECPVSTLTEIEDLRAELAGLIERLDRLQGTLPRPMILILEMSEFGSVLHRAVLRRFGDAYDVVLAQSALDAVSWMGRRRVPLLITELSLEASYADELIRTTQTISPKTEILVQTGAWSLGTEWTVRKLGVHYYIEKPYFMDELSILIDQALARTKEK